MRHTLRRSVPAVTFAMVWGCATAPQGTTQRITVSSNVDGARIFLDGEMVGTTPFTGVVPKGASELHVEMEGFRPGRVTLSNTVGGTLGNITGFTSGAAYQYAPVTYQIDLIADGQWEVDFYKEVAVRKFSMLYVHEISRDVAAGGGHYLDTLLAILAHRADRDLGVEFVAEALVRSSGDAVRFGREVVEQQ